MFGVIRRPSKYVTIGHESVFVLAEVIMKLQSETPHTQHTNGITAIDPQTHELGANLIFTAHDLNPHYALDRLIKQDDGATTETISFDKSR